jgi:hypothetical protein
MNGEVKPVQEEDKEDSKSAIIEVFPPPTADPINGRYKLVKTENFDEFMKKLGVGLIKRKLANSVSPLNVIMVNDDGKYILKSEIRFDFETRFVFEINFILKSNILKSIIFKSNILKLIILKSILF